MVHVNSSLMTGLEELQTNLDNSSPIQIKEEIICNYFLTCLYKLIWSYSDYLQII